MSKLQIINTLSDYVDATIIETTLFSFYLDLIVKAVYWLIPLFYFYRFKFSRKRSQEESQRSALKDLESGRTVFGTSGIFDIQLLVGSLLALSVWNGLLILFSDRIFLDFPTVIGFLKHNGSLLEPGTFHLWKDLKLLGVVAVSIVLMNAFVVGILRSIPEAEIIERSENDVKIHHLEKEGSLHIQDRSYSEPVMTQSFKKSLSSEGVPFEHDSKTEFNHSNNLFDEETISKRVSFDHFATLIHFNSSEDLTNSPIEFIPIESESCEWRNLKKFLGAFFTILLASIFLLPNNFKLNSSFIIVAFDSNFQVKSDNVFISLIGAFIYDSWTKFFGSLTKPGVCDKFKCFLRSTILFSKFTGAYSCFILVVSSSFLIIFNDVLLNLIHAIVNGSSASSVSNDSGAYPIQFITSILMNYLSHSSFNPLESLAEMCNEADSNISYSNCIQTQSIYTSISSFYNLYLIMENCWKVLNLFCFVLLPGIIWMIIEYKNCRQR